MPLQAHQAAPCVSMTSVAATITKSCSAPDGTGQNQSMVFTACLRPLGTLVRMANNVYRFRRLKWGDPEQKLQMLPPDPPRHASLPWFEMLCILATLAFGAIIVLPLWAR